MMRQNGPWLCVLSMAVAGCGSDGASTDENAEAIPNSELCPEPMAPRSLAWSERSPLGFSADELLGALGSQYRGRFEYADATTTALTVGVERASGGVVYHEDPSDGSAAEPMGERTCFYGVSIPATLTLATEDGAFAESWPLSLHADGATSAVGEVPPFDLDDLVGNYRVTGFDPMQYDALRVQIGVTFEAHVWSGALTIVAERLLATGSQAVARVEFFEIGTF